MSIQFEGFGGIALAADVHGRWNGPPVILLHGEGRARHVWLRTGALLAEYGFLAVALDTRGHGGSRPARDGDYTLDTCAADLLMVADQVGGRAALVGESAGGLMALIAAAEMMGTQCTALVLADTVPRFNATSPVDNAGRSRLPAIAPERYEHAAAALDAPALLIRGGLADCVSEQTTTVYSSVARHIECVDVPPRGHVAARYGADPFTRLIAEFLLNAHAFAPAGGLSPSGVPGRTRASMEADANRTDRAG